MVLPMTVYTKLAAKAQPSENGIRHSRSSSSPTTTNAPASSIFSVLSGDSNQTVVPPQEQSDRDATLQATPAPLNTSISQRAVSAPNTGYPSPTFTGAPNTQRSISMVMDNSKPHGEESPVMNETLSVIDEHITDMNTPRSSLRASARRNGNDSASEYSSHIDHRLSYITGNETDEEEADTLTEGEVGQWSPSQVAEYLQELGVEERHCEVFREQEISGEVLLNIDKSSVFMKELDLGSVGRRLATWHKIKAFQEGVKSVKGRQRTSAPDGDGSVIGSIATSVSQSSTNGSMLPKVPHYSNRSPQPRHSRQNSPRIISEPQYPGFEGESSGVPKIYSPDSTTRPSAASIRDYNHTRRHSSVDFSKSDASSSMHTTTGATPPTSPGSSGHQKQPSFDRNWTMSAFPPHTHPSQTRASTMLGLSALGMASPALPLNPERNAFTPGAENANPLDYDRGYLSSGEVESRKNRNVLRKTHPGSASHSRQNSHKEGNGMKRHSRFGSAGSIMEALTSVTNSSSKQSSSDALKARARTQSLKDTNSSMATLPSNSSTNTSTPIVTKLDYSESPTSITSKSNPGSPATKSEGFAPFGSVTSKLRTSLRSASDTAGGNSEKSQMVSPASMPSPIKETPVDPPPRSRTFTISAPSKHLDVETTAEHSNKMVTIFPASRTPSLGTKKAKNKKETSAYRSLMVISPQKALQSCTHSGWMYKKSAKMTSAFKSRFFVLRDKRLSYYYSLSDKIEKGLIDINSHRVMFVENDIMTSLYSTLAGTKSNPNSPANAPSGEGNDLQNNPEKTAGGPFFFKLVPPRTGLSKAVQFTRPAVHYFAVDNYQEGREWFLALKKASIDRDETQPVTSTYSQKTISLAKAQAMKQRPPALMADENADASSDAQSKDETSNPKNPGLNIDGLNLGYDYDPTKGKSESGTPESSAPNSAGLPDAEAKRPQSDEPRLRASKAGNESGSTLRMVRSMSGGISRESTNAPEDSPDSKAQANASRVVE